MPREILATGIDYSTGDLLIDPIDEQSFARKVEGSLGQYASELRTTAEVSTRALEFRDIMEQVPDPNLGDPKAAGWTFLINSKDPHQDNIINAVHPLAEYRGMKDPSNPLLFNGESIEDWSEWLDSNYYKKPEISPPYYVLIIGQPDQVPFEFQSFMSTCPAAIGRVDFDSVGELSEYIEKILRLERAGSPVVSREAIFFAPDAGWPDPTYYSRRYMAEPLANYVNSTFTYETQKVIGDDATKKQLLGSLSDSKSALIYTASHGIAAPNKNLEVQKKVNGSICCQKNGNEEKIEDYLFTADDIPVDKPFLEGAVFFQFACFGYGTPKESDYNHWLGRDPRLNANEDFIAAIPKKLLSHPKGPIGFIGHVDLAWVHGFDDPKNPDLPGMLEQPWSSRIRPFLKAVESLINKAMPAGRAMAEMGKRLAQLNQTITGRYDLLQRKPNLPNLSEIRGNLSSDFITRSDAKNYMIFGDPAARLLIAK